MKIIRTIGCLLLAAVIGASFSAQGMAWQKKSSKVKTVKKKTAAEVFPDFPKKALWLGDVKPPENFFDEKITLVYFWDYSSINCIRELRTLKSWEAHYKPYRFQILWVHAPEFAAGADPENVKDAVKRFGIKGPVLLDHQFKLWDKLGVRAWPAKILLNEKKEIIYRKGGEGDHFFVEAKIRGALKGLDAGAVLPAAIFDNDEPSYDPQECGEMIGETYLGFKKASWMGAKIGNKQWLGPNETQLFRDTEERTERGFFLEGLWSNREEYLEHARQNEDLSDYVGLLYRGREAYVTAQAPGQEKGARVYVTRDENPVPVGYRGEDIEVDDTGETYFTPTRHRLYYLIKGEDTEIHELKLWTSVKGVRFYSFSFSNLCLSEFEHY